MSCDGRCGSHRAARVLRVNTCRAVAEVGGDGVRGGVAESSGVVPGLTWRLGSGHTDRQCGLVARL